MNELKERLDSLSGEFTAVVSSLNLPAKQAHLKQLQGQTTAADFWQDETKAKHTMQQISSLKEEIDTVLNFKFKLTSLHDLLDLSLENDDQSVQSDLSIELAKLESAFGQLKLRALLSGPHDQAHAYLSIHSGQGGTEAMDWASMLSRMYQRYFEIKGWDFDIVDQSPGEEAGLKSITFLLKASYAYGYLKSEAGTHRLVRLSPFNADNLRQTSFALVEVLPVIENQNQDIDIKDSDLTWQFYRSGGKGGQNVNKVSTAVRLTHQPSGIVVTSQSQRHQEQNRQTALGLLKSKLWQLQQAEQSKQAKQIKGEHQGASFGSQIRSYVLHPYQLVKDTRTNYETSDTEAVLGGQLDDFIQAYLISVRSAKS